MPRRTLILSRGEIIYLLYAKGGNGMAILGFVPGVCMIVWPARFLETVVPR